MVVVVVADKKVLVWSWSCADLTEFCAVTGLVCCQPCPCLGNQPLVSTVTIKTEERSQHHWGVIVVKAGRMEISSSST